MSKRADAGLIAPAELDDRDLSSWGELAERSSEPNPFHHPDFVLPAARALDRVEDISILRIDAVDGAWTGCLPVIRERGWHSLPLRSLATWLHPYSLLGSPLLAPDDPDAHRSALVETMLSEDAVAGLDWIPDDHAIDGAVELSGFERPVLRRQADGDYLGERVKGKHRREFRRLARGLEEELGGPLELVDRSSEDEAVEGFLKLEASGWKGRDGTALASVPAHADFFRDVARRFRRRDAFELLTLEAGGRTAAARCSLLAGGVGFCFKIAYDEDLSRYSPGRELELRVIDRFHEDPGMRWLDSCAQPGSQVFERLWPDRRRLVTVACTGGGAGARALRAALSGAAALRRQRERSAGAAE